MTESGFARALQEGRLRLGEAEGKAPPPGLRRFLEPRQAPRPGERCELCTEPLPDEHAHLVNMESRGLLCSCRACYLLFTHTGAGQGKYRAVPERYLHDPAFALSDGQWDALQIPVRMAFFFRNSALDQMVGFYPSPAGATESLLDLDTFAEVLDANPAAATLAPDVEALLVNRTEAGPECFLVPIDACYELVGRVRRGWKGFDGGTEVWRDIDAFFDCLRERSRPMAMS